MTYLTYLYFLITVTILSLGIGCGYSTPSTSYICEDNLKQRYYIPSYEISNEILVDTRKGHMFPINDCTKAK